MDTPTHTTIAQRLAELAEAELRVKELRDSLRADYDALREGLPRSRKRQAKAVPVKRSKGKLGDRRGRLKASAVSEPAAQE